MKEHFEIAGLSIDVTRDEQLCSPTNCPLSRFGDRIKKSRQTFRDVMRECLYLRLSLKGIYSDTERITLFNERQRPKSPIFVRCNRGRPEDKEQLECGSILIKDEIN